MTKGRIPVGFVLFRLVRKRELKLRKEAAKRMREFEG